MKKFLMTFLILTAAVFAACQSAATENGAIKQASVQETSDAVNRGGVQFVDVRAPEEYNGGHAPKAVNMPLDTFEKELAGLDREKPVYLICQSGRRSQKAAEMLENNNFKKIYNVAGGTSAWTTANLPLEK